MTPIKYASRRSLCLLKLRQNGVGVLIALGFGIGLSARAETMLSVNAPERLSVLFKDNAIQPSATDEALPSWAVSWQVAQEVSPQQVARRRLLDNLLALHDQNTKDVVDKIREPLVKLHVLKVKSNFNSTESDVLQLAKQLATLPVTGRAPLAQTDRFWLILHPEHDPIVQIGDVIRIDSAPLPVTVVDGRGNFCTVTYKPQASLLEYLTACLDPHQVDSAWLTEPNGAIRVEGLAAFNRSPVIEPVPGAYIFAPFVQEHMSAELSLQVATVLATQLPASPASLTLDSTDQPQGNRRSAAVDQSRVAATLDQGPRATVALTDAVIANQSVYVPDLSRNDIGVIGLLETPSARQADAGDVAFVGNVVYPYERTNVMFQRSDWMEGGFRYTRVCDVPFGGPADRPINFCYEDKSTTLKMKVLTESRFLPQVAIGLNDLLGTGLFSGEYVVASKRVNNFDISTGMGFGYFGSLENSSNPLGVLSSHFKTRQSPGHGFVASIINYNAWFTGKGAWFGGVQYQSPIPHLSLKLEVEGNNYQNEPLGNVFKVNSPLGANHPVNVGLTYQWPHLELTAALERGNTFAVNLNYHGNLSKIGVATPWPKPELLAEETQLAVSPADQQVLAHDSTGSIESAQEASTLGFFKTSTEISDSLKATLVEQIRSLTGWTPLKLKVSHDEWQIELADGSGAFINERLERLGRLLNKYAPESIKLFTVDLQSEGMAISRFPIDRDRLVARQAELLPPSVMEPPVLLQEKPIINTQTDAWDQPDVLATFSRSHAIDWGLGVGYQQIIAGPNGFGPVYDTNVDLNTRMDVWRGAFLSSTLSVQGLNNFSRYVYTYNGAGNPGNYQYVRRHLSDYILDGKGITLRELQLTDVEQFGSDHFVSVYAGYLEWMFRGYGGEYLYRPSGSHYGLGGNINYVQQRDFQQDFGLLKPKYSVTTGHAVGVWETDDGGWRAKLSYGRYLAGDKGGTLDLSRRFSNGMRLGAYVTKTNMSSIDFTEGGSDRGIYFSLPFDALLNSPSPSVATFNWEVYYKDGGAMLARRYQLWDMTDARSGSALQVGP